MKKRLTKLLIPILASVGMMAAMAVETGALPPVYNDYVYDALKNNYLVIRDVDQNTASMSIGASYKFHKDATRDLYGHKNAHGQYSYGVAQSYRYYWLISNTHIYKSNEIGVWYGSKYQSSSYSDETKLRIGGDFKKDASVSSGDIEISGRAGQIEGEDCYTYDSETFGTAAKGGEDVPFGNALFVKGEIFNLTVVPVDNDNPAFVEAYGDGTFEKLYLRFDEQIRTASADTDLSKYTLTVSYVNAESGTGGGQLTYVCTGVSGDSLVYEPLASQALPGVGRYQIVSIDQSGNAAPDYKFDVWGLTELNERRYLNDTIEKYSLKEVILTQIDGMYALSDLAGNAVSVPSNLNLEKFNIIVDNQSPSVEKVYLSGGMVTDISALPEDQWPADIDLSAIYAGSGDQMYFNVRFDEVLQSASGSITLNVMQNGANITLNNPKISTVTNAMGESATLLTYGPFTVSEGMTMDPAYADQAIGIKSMSGTFTDTVGNQWIPAELPVNAHKIRLDTEAPAVSMELYSWRDAAGKPVLTPTIRLSMEDGISGMLGLTGKIGIALNTSEPVTYKMALTDSTDKPAASEYKYSGTVTVDADGNPVPVMADIDLYSGVKYIHLDLMENKAVNIYGLSAVYSLPDWAGNRAEGSITASEYVIDTAAPTVTAPMLDVTYSADGAVITGSWTTYEKNKTVDAYFQWSNTKPDYNTGWTHAGRVSENENAQWTLPEDAAKVISGENAEVTLWVYAKDTSGNASSIISASQRIYAEKAASTFVLKTDAQEHLAAHEVLVTPLVSKIGDQNLKTYTRVRVTFGDGYVHSNAPAEVSAYLASGKTAYVVLNSDNGMQNIMELILDSANKYTAGLGDTCTDAEQISLGTVLDYWYGEVSMAFESACYDLTVQAGEDIVSGIISADNPLAATYSGIEGSVSFMHVPDGAAKVWEASVTDKPDSAQLYNRTLEGQEFTVKLETLFKANAEDYNNAAVDMQLDGTNSFVTVRNKDTAEVLMTAPLYAMEQSFRIPAGEYATGVYEIAVTYSHSAGLTWNYVCDEVLVVDNEKPQSAQVTEYYITPGSTLGYEDGAPSFIKLDENGKPVLTQVSGAQYADDKALYVIEKTVASGENLNELTLSLAGQKEAVRAANYSAETSGLYNFGITFGFEGEATKLVGGMTAGKVEGLYIWNPAVHASRAEGWKVTEEDGWEWQYDSKNASEYYNWSENATSGLMNAEPKKTDGFYDMTGELKLKDGENTIRYQVVMENGNVSPVYELKIYVTSSAPEAGLKIDAKKSLKDPASDGEPINIVNADVSLANVFSGSDIVEYYWLDKNNFKVVETPASEIYDKETEMFKPVSEVVKTYEYNRYEVVRDLENGYYADLGLPANQKYAIATGAGFYDSNGKVVEDTSDLDGYFNYSSRYFVTETEADTVVRLDNNENYGTMSGYFNIVSDKYSDDTASGAFMVIDESGATVLVFPQLKNSGNYYDPTEGEVSPQYNMVGKSAYFIKNLQVYAYSNYVDYRGVRVEAEIYNAAYIDETKSYVVYLTESGETIKLPFTESACRMVGTEGASFSVNASSTGTIAIEFCHPITDGTSVAVGTKVPVSWMYVEMYDSNTGEYLVSDTVTIDQLEYRSSKYESIKESITSYIGYSIDYNVHCYQVVWRANVRLNDGETCYYTQYITDVPGSGTYTYQITDVWGNTYTEELTFVSTVPVVELSSTEATSKPIIATITVPENFPLDECIIFFRNESTKLISGELREDCYLAKGDTIELQISEPEMLHFWVSNEEYYVPIDNVSAAIPEPSWSINVWYEKELLFDENGNLVYDDDGNRVEVMVPYTDNYNGGDVTVFLEDVSGLWKLIDPLTGERPEYTFKWDDPSLTLDQYGFAVYTFRDVCTNELDENGNYVRYGDYTVTCPVLLREYIAPEIENFYPEEEAPVIPAKPDDTRKPSVQITPYAIRDGKTQQLDMYYIAEDLSDKMSNGVIEPINPNLMPKDESHTAYTDSAAMISAVGWANRFRFQVEVQDNSKTRIFIKEGLYPDVEVTYEDGTSDAISGVSLSGAILDVTAAAKFTLYVVDEKNNTVIIPMDISNISESPIPTYQKILLENGDGTVNAAIQLIAPDGGSNIVVTALDGTELEEPADIVTVDKNGTYTVSYSFVYGGTTISGSMVITISDIDNVKPAVLNVTWSRNAGKPTNTDVYAYIDFNKEMIDVQINTEDVNEADYVTVLLTGTRASVRYAENTSELKMIFKAVNGQWTETVTLNEVDGIDREAPGITVSVPEVSKDAKSAVITLTSNEKVSFREGNGIGTEFQRTLRDNGTYTYNFTDMAGNTTVAKVELTALVTDPIVMQYSLNANGAGAADTPVALGTVSVGDTFYVKVSRDSDLHFDGKIVSASADEWTEMTVGAESGGVIMAKDIYGNTASGVFPEIFFPDLTPPMIDLKQYTVHASLLNTDSAELEELLRDNAITADDREGNVILKLEYVTPDGAGTSVVKYIAVDASANTADIEGLLRIYDGSAPEITLDGVFVDRGSICITENDAELLLSVNLQNEPYKVIWKTGIKTEAQMKNGSTELEMNDGQAALPFAGEKGYYTVCVSSQSRDIYRFIVFVK